MFLLKEDNYKKDFKEFQNDFEILEINNLSLSENDIFFEEYDKCKGILNYENLSKAIFIKSKTGENLQIPYITFRNDSGMRICSKDC